MRHLYYVVIAAAISGSSIAPVHAQTALQNHCQTTPVRADALDFPSKHAWDLFMVLNHPALPSTIERGSPDCAKPIGAPGTTAVWETWRNGKTEVFLSDGREPPLWNDISLPDDKPGSTPANVGTESAVAGKPSPPAAPTEKREFSFHEMQVAPGPGIEFSHGSNDEQGGVFGGNGGFGETRMNRATYEFIRKECLWSKEGGRRYAQAMLDGKKPPITLPPDSIEVKAAWLDFEREKIPADIQKTFYTAEYNKKKYGLTALHVITKDTPNWFWATFHHKRTPQNPFEVPDAFGQPSALKGTVWENYELGGTQTEFETSVGKPTLLSDHYVEFTFQRSSCISCHATATISSTGARKASQGHSLCSLSPTVGGLTPKDCKDTIGEDKFKPEPHADELRIERGTPLPEWFEENGKQFYFQTDFLYSINFRARKEATAPPRDASGRGTAA